MSFLCAAVILLAVFKYLLLYHLARALDHRTEGFHFFNIVLAGGITFHGVLVNFLDS